MVLRSALYGRSSSAVFLQQILKPKAPHGVVHVPLENYPVYLRSDKPLIPKRRCKSELPKDNQSI